VHHSPHPTNTPVSRVSPPIIQSAGGQDHPSSHFVRPPYPSYSLPAMPGPVMTNVNSPGGQMTMVGSLQQGLIPSYNSGYIASTQTVYGGHPPQPSQPAGNDRPFKCDQCPQSFNRNHDLKRHKRIHLAVKPFPCLHCEKSFSRKDALKRHILVKGCGKRGDSDSTKGDDDPGRVKSESVSEEAGDSPPTSTIQG